MLTPDQARDRAHDIVARAKAAGADAGPEARGRMHAAFRACSEHELAFWDAAWQSR